MAARDEFSSKFGFVMAAAGSAVGLGNIWGFPTQVASNGGAAFVIVYLALTFVLAYPVLMAELLVGRYAKSNSIDAYPKVTGYNKSVFLGVWGTLTVSAILAFYSIVGGWLMAWMLHYCAKLIGLIGVAEWLIEFSLERNIIFAIVFSSVTLLIVKQGVASGIERWSVRLMPSLLALMAILIVYVGLQPGAAEGWSVFIVPDFGRVFDADLVIGAMGQAFFFPVFRRRYNADLRVISIQKRKYGLNRCNGCLGGRRGSDFGRRTNYSCNVRSTSFRRTDI